MRDDEHGLTVGLGRRVAGMVTVTPADRIAVVRLPNQSRIALALCESCTRDAAQQGGLVVDPYGKVFLVGAHTVLRGKNREPCQRCFQLPRNGMVEYTGRGVHAVSVEALGAPDEDAYDDPDVMV